MTIDAHHHLWRPSRGDYGWIPEGDPVLDRAYCLADLDRAVAGCEISGTVLVQAAPSTAETEYLLGIADASSLIKAVVGWFDFERLDQRNRLERFARHPKFRSVRPMLQDIGQDDWILLPSVRWALDAVEELGLAFDALGFAQHGPHLLRLAAERPGLRMVLDHALKPPIVQGIGSRSFHG